jgi:hypothetical protein
MSSQRDEFPQAIKEVLAKRAGQRCSNPTCVGPTSGPHADESKAINLGVAAHITAAAPGGPRYNPNLSPEERAAISNGIWLCQTCAKLVDSDTATYPEERLIIWKRHHEESVQAAIAGTGKTDISTRGTGVLNFSAVYQHAAADGRSCILDFRVSNQGQSDLLINAIEFQVLESLIRIPLGGANYSALYDLDISDLKEFSTRADCQVAQILKPGEADRFGIVLSAPSLHVFAGWRFATLFKTNFGTTQGPQVEVWLPHPETLRSFASVTGAIKSAAEAEIKRRAGIPGLFPVGVPNSQLDDPGQFDKFMEAGGVAKSEPGKSAGFVTLVVLGIAIMWYYGPQPLVETE